MRLHKDGEPLMAPQIFELIDHIKTMAPSTLLNMDTNALLLDEEKADKMLDSKLDVLLFSVNAATAETYKKVRGSTKYDQVITNIERFLAMRKERGYVWPKVKVQLIVMAETKNEIGLFHGAVGSARGRCAADPGDQLGRPPARGQEPDAAAEEALSLHLPVEFFLRQLGRQGQFLQRRLQPPGHHRRPARADHRRSLEEP